MANDRSMAGMIVSALFAAFFSAVAVEAAPLPPTRVEFCGNLNKLIQFVDTCEKNVILAEMALRCTIKLQQGSEKLATSLGQIFSKGAAAQAASMAANAGNLKPAEESLLALEKKNDIAIEDTLYYFLNLVHPDELYEISPKIDPKVFLRKTLCFADNKRKLLIALTEMEDNKRGLILAREALNQISDKTNQEIVSMLGAAFPKVNSAEPRAKKEPFDFNRKKHRIRNSDITKEKEK